MGPNQREKPLNIAEFIAKRRKAELKERSAAQEHFLDLCRLLAHPAPAEAGILEKRLKLNQERTAARINPLMKECRE